MASSSVARSNTIQTVRDYVTRMCTDVPGMKVLVMDAETTGVVSMVFTQTQVLQHEVFMTDTIERQAGEKMPHLKACYFVRPTAENLRRIQSELREPRLTSRSITSSYVPLGRLCHRWSEYTLSPEYESVFST